MSALFLMFWAQVHPHTKPFLPWSFLSQHHSCEIMSQALPIYFTIFSSWVQGGLVMRLIHVVSPLTKHVLKCWERKNNPQKTLRQAGFESDSLLSPIVKWTPTSQTCIEWAPIRDTDQRCKVARTYCWFQLFQNGFSCLWGPFHTTTYLPISLAISLEYKEHNHHNQHCHQYNYN